MKYLIELSDAQANVLEDACDCYVRLHLGQLQYVADFAVKQAGLDNGMALRSEMLKLNPLITGFPNVYAGHGIFNELVHEDAKIAHDIHSVIRHRRSRDGRPEGGIGCNFDDPLQAAKEPLPTIESKGGATC